MTQPTDESTGETALAFEDLRAEISLLRRAVEHDHVLAEAVEDLGAVQDQLEVVADLRADARAHLLERLVRRHVGAAAAVGGGGVDPEVRGEDDQRLGEVDPVATSRRQDPVVEDLQELVEDARVRLLDLVEEDDREGALPHGVGEFTARVVTDVSGRCADQPLVGVLRAELGHVETDVCALVAEQELGDRLGEFGLADAGRPGEEGYAARATAAATTADARGGPLHDVEHVHDGVVLADDASLDDVRAVADPTTLDLAPRVLGDPDLVALDRLGDVLHRDALGARKLRYRTQVDQQHPLRCVDEVGDRGLDDLLTGCAGARHAPHQRRCHRPSGGAVGRRDRDMAQPGIVYRQPVRKIALAFGDPDDAVVARRAIRSHRARLGGLAEHQRTGEQRLLLRRQRVVTDDEPGSEVGDESDRRTVQPDEALERRPEQVGPGRCPAVRGREAEARQHSIGVA